MINKNGFTIFEILIVLTMAAVLTAASAVALSQYQSILKLRNAGDEIRALVQVGRQYTIANKDSAGFNLTLNSRIIKLLENSQEISRYSIPAGIEIAPLAFSWNYAPVTGKLDSCAPCQIVLSSLGNTEIINIRENGMVY